MPSVGLTAWYKEPSQAVHFEMANSIIFGQGLDGEATEPMVNELKEQEATEAGSEEEFAVARALLDGSFLPQLLQRLQACETVGYQESAESTLLLRLLHQAVHLDVSLTCPLLGTMARACTCKRFAQGSKQSLVPILDVLIWLDVY